MDGLVAAKYYRRKKNGWNQIYIISMIEKVLIVIKRFAYIVIRLLGCFLILASCGSSSKELNNWVGYYHWGNSVPGVTSGSLPLVEDHAILIYEEGDDFFADYVLNGHMLGVRMKARVHGDKDSITITLLEYAPDTYQQPFQVGDELVRLAKDGNNIITKWEVDKPYFEKDYETEGIYFLKDDSYIMYFAG